MKHAASFKASTLLTWFGLAIAIPLLLLAGGLLRQTAAVERARNEARLEQVLQAVVTNLDREFDRDITILRTMGTSQAMQRQDWRTFYEQAKASLQGRSYLVVVDAQGRQLINTYVPYGQQPPFTGDPETVRRMVRTKEPVVSNLFTSLVVKRPVYNVSIPVLQGGEVRYVMSLGQLPEQLGGLLESQTKGTEWATLIWDDEGVILAQSPGQAGMVGQRLPENLRRAGEPVVRTRNASGVDVLQMSARSKIANWGVGVSIPYATVTQQRQTWLRLWMLAALVAVALTILLGVVLARQISEPLGRAMEAAEAHGRGEQIPLTGSRLREADAFLGALREAQEARQKLMEELKRNRDWLETTLASIGDAVIAADGEGRVTFLNGVAQRLTGADETAIGRPWNEILVMSRDEDGPPMGSPLNEALGEGREERGQQRYLRNQEGRAMPVEYSVAPIRSDRGERLGAVLVFRDVTARKQAQDALNRNVTELQRANRDLSHFAFAASHDLQEPLRMITSYSQLLVDGCRASLTDEAEHCVRFITIGTRRMRQLLTDLLAYTQVSHDGDESAGRLVDLNRVFEEAVGNCRTAIEESRATVTRDELPAMVVEEFHWLQLFQNLLSNSLKYRGTATPVVHLSVRQQDNGYEFALRDNGMGIAPEFHEQIFGVFKRLHGPEIPGTGIGLALCERVVQRYGGKIWVQSQSEAGTTIFFTVPATRGRAASQHA